MVKSETIQNLHGSINYVNPVPIGCIPSSTPRFRRGGLFDITAHLSHIVRHRLKILLNGVIRVKHLLERCCDKVNLA